MISALTWIPRGAARAKPVRYEISKEEYEHIKQLAEEEKQQQEQVQTENGDQEGDDNEEVDTSDLPPELKMEEYDDDEEVNLGDAITEGELNELGEYGVLEQYDSALAVDVAPEDSDEEDDAIRENDSLLVVAHTEDDYSYLEVQVLDADANFYVHHDVTLPSFPLCLAWLDCPPHVPQSEGDAHVIGNYIAVGTFEPAIEIWNLDVLDPLEPSAVLGGYDETKKKKKNKKKKGPQLKPDSHEAAVLGLCWNKEHRQLLASCSADHTAKLWDVTTQQCSYTFTHHTDKVSAVRWHPSEGSVLATGSYDKSVAVLDARAPTEVSRFEISADLEHLEWDPFRPFNLTAATEDGVIICKDVRAMDQNIFRFQAHEATVSSFAYSPLVEGMLATASLDKTVKLWDVHAPEPFCVAYKSMAVGKLLAVQFYSDDPFTLATGGSKGMVAVWDASELDVVRNHFGGRVSSQRSVYQITAETAAEQPEEAVEMAVSQQASEPMIEESKEQKPSKKSGKGKSRQQA